MEAELHQSSSGDIAQQTDRRSSARTTSLEYLGFSMPNGSSAPFGGKVENPTGSPTENPSLVVGILKIPDQIFQLYRTKT